MKELNKEKIGTFIAQKRKERALTQKELAEQLFVSDKAVSKWERGLSVPDVSLLSPLAELLGVTITELLQGEQLTSVQLKAEQVESLVVGTIRLTQEEQREEDRKKRWLWKGTWLLCALLAAAEVGCLWRLAIPMKEIQTYVLMVEGLTLIFSGYFCFFVKEHLPDYYDTNSISAYSDGVFRMNLPGVRFTNQNWPHIVNIGRGWLLGVAVTFPGFYLLIRNFLSGMGLLSTILFVSLSFFVPMVWAGKKYE